jgi:type I restriction enzyme S subunit
MNLLEKHFDLAFAAPDGIQKLRELILTLAMQGKLVPQDPDDQPASELLKEIEAEKQQLVKKGKIKPPKPSAEIKSEEVPYDLPKGWKWCYLDDICTLITDGTHHTPTYIETGIPFISVKDVSSGVIDFSTTRFISEQEHEELIKRCHPEQGDVLLTKVGTTGIAVPVNTDTQFSIFVSVALLKLVQKFIDTNYVTRLINSPLVRKYSVEGTEGVGNKNLVLRKIKAFLIPLPPLAEQHRIVAKIDRLMARCDELEKLRAERNQKRITIHTAACDRLLTAKESNDFSTAWRFITQHFGELYSVKENVAELRRAILQLAVMGKLVPQDPDDEPASELLRAIELEKKRLVKEGKIKQSKPLQEIKPEEVPYDLPKGWEWVRLGHITSKITDGDHQTPPRISEGYRLLSAKNVRDGYLDFDNCDFISKEHYLKSRERCCPELNDLLIVSVGGTIGRTSLVPEDSFFALVRSVALIKPLLITSSYLKYSMDSNLLQNSIHARKRGGAQPCLYLSEIEKFLFSLPPLAEQRRIVTKIDKLMALCDQLDQQIDAATSKQTTLLNAVMAQV